MFIGYCGLSCLTLPFIGKFWLGELPVLATLQLPKIAVAGWLRTHVVMEAIQWLGLSKGSFSPDYILARPYALAIAYVIPMLFIGAIWVWRFRALDRRCGWLTLGVLLAAVTDYVFTLAFANGRSLTIY